MQVIPTNAKHLWKVFGSVALTFALQLTSQCDVSPVSKWKVHSTLIYIVKNENKYSHHFPYMVMFVTVQLQQYKYIHLQALYGCSIYIYAPEAFFASNSSC